MGSNRVDGDMMILAEVDFGSGGGSLVPQQQIHRKHRRKKVELLNGDGGGGGLALTSNGDADIVTPYQNGHYTNGYQNGYHQHRGKLPHRHSSFDDNQEDDNEAEDDQVAQLQTGYGDYLSPHPPLQNLLLDEHPQSSVNNAITVAPSRTNLNDSNVFAGGRPTNNLAKRPNHRNNNRHNRHKGRSRTPDFTTSSNHRLRAVDEEPHDSQSILNRIDLSIRKNFGEWDNDEGDVSKKLINGTNNPKNGVVNGKPHKVPYFIPKHVASDSDVVGLMGSGNDLNLPRLFKPYESEVATSKKVLNDKTYKVALSRDNDDPNSILSQAKKTLSYVSGQ